MLALLLHLTPGCAKKPEPPPETQPTAPPYTPKSRFFDSPLGIAEIPFRNTLLLSFFF